ncbi:MAG: nicotinamide mononucleotide transporter [Lachnospiraceae bacterium]|nr:nicotinamide mononucleotide transporter [Lachnospiraceae bacterium]
MTGSKIRKHFKEEFMGWKIWEVFWLFLACFIIMLLSIYWKDTAMGIISATTGVACVVCTGKGKLSAYLFGTINIVLYAIIAYNAKFYGEVMLNALYYLPMQFYGLYVWGNNMNSETHEVKKREMNKKGKGIIVLVIVLGTLVYGAILNIIGGSLPYFDALSTVVSVVAMIISIKMYAEQWLLWIVVDIVTVVMWAVAFAKGNDSIATLIMWIVYLGNAFIMYFKWKREATTNAI